MAISPEFREELLSSLQNLRGFAYSLCGDVDKGDDLVQETLLKAWDKHELFEAGTNLKAWLFTIMRNEFYSRMRKKTRETEDPDEILAGKLAVHPAQDGHMDMQDFRSALTELPNDQREALILVGASGFSYEEAADVCDCAVGTIKSRVNRARNRLAELLNLADATGLEFGIDAKTHAVVPESKVV